MLTRRRLMSGGTTWVIGASGEIGDRTFEIRFLDSGAQSYAFTFG